MVAFWIALAAMAAFVIIVIVAWTRRSMACDRAMEELAEQLAEENDDSVWIIWS